MYLAPAATSFAKFLGTKMGVRLILLFVVGLGALYTIHLLAQDYMKISAGAQVGKVFLKKFGKKKVHFKFLIKNSIQQLDSCWEKEKCQIAI